MRTILLLLCAETVVSVFPFPRLLSLSLFLFCLCSLLPSFLQKIPHPSSYLSFCPKIAPPPRFLFPPIFIGIRGRGSPYPVQVQGMVAWDGSYAVVAGHLCRGGRACGYRWC